MRVDINGRSSGVIKLPNIREGDTFNHNQLFLPLSLMRPGLNRIDIFAETPRAGDADCDGVRRTSASCSSTPPSSVLPTF